MSLFNRTRSIAVLCLLFSQQLLASPGSLSPKTHFSYVIKHSLKKLDALISHSAKTGNTGAKICSCQILEMKSSNYEHKNMAVFAEKTNYGNFSSDFSIAKDVIEKEKKHIRKFFYDKVKVLDQVSEATDCKSLYVKMKGADESLVMYDILDADVKR